MFTNTKLQPGQYRSVHSSGRSFILKYYEQRYYWRAFEEVGGKQSEVFFGQEVSKKALLEFLEEQIQPTVASKSLGLTPVPKQQPTLRQKVDWSKPGLIKVTGQDDRQSLIEVFVGSQLVSSVTGVLVAQEVFISEELLRERNVNPIKTVYE